MENIISVQNITFQYEPLEENSRLILNDVSLAVKKGEFLAILGHNGSGKSTLAKHFNALLAPQTGRVTVCGLDTAVEENKFKIRQQVGMVFQNPDNQLVATIVEEDVAFGPENLGVPPLEIRERVDEALKAVDMYEYRLHAPHKLSGGQKQRVAIAGIIAMKPRCIVLDEPTAMLDPKGRTEVLNTIRKLNRENNITIIYITHYMEEAALADRIIVMNEGKIALTGTPHEVFHHVEYLKSINLDVPEAAELSYILKENNYSIGDHIINEEEFIKSFIRYLKEN